MTKTIILGEQKDKSTKKPIEFFSQLDINDSDDVEVEDVGNEPCDWNYIELICKEYSPNLDLMFAYDDADNRGNGVLMVGRWNSGTVK